MQIIEIVKLTDNNMNREQLALQTNAIHLTTESGEESQNDQICRIKMRIIEIVKCTDNNMNREKLALHCIEAYKMQYI